MVMRLVAATIDFLTRMEECRECGTALRLDAGSDVVACSGQGCGALFHGRCCRGLQDDDVLQTYVARRAVWKCDSCKGDAVGQICRTLLDVERSLAHFSDKLEVFQSSLLAANGAIKTVTEGVVQAPREDNYQEHERSNEGALYKEKGELDHEAAVVTLASKALQTETDRDSTDRFCDQKTAQLYVAAKQFARQNDYRFVWLRYSTVFLRRDEGSGTSVIRHYCDIPGRRKEFVTMNPLGSKEWP